LLIIKVRYFGILRELVDLNEEEYVIENGNTVEDLILKIIPKRHNRIAKDWKNILFKNVNGEIVFDSLGNPSINNYIILVEGKLENLSKKMNHGETVSILPPFGGG
jgi:molybdopterin converting factor small subunit